MDVEAFAVENAFALIADELPVGRDGVVALVDIGATMTTLNVLRGGRSLYSREQVFGGKQLTDEVMRRYGLTYEEAGRLSARGGLPETYEVEVLEPFKEATVQQISRLLQFFYAGSEFNRVDQGRAGGRLRVDPGLVRNGRGATGRADPDRQPAGADDPRSPRAGARAGTGCAGADDRHRAGPEELRLMARINLLPWRAERRKQRQREFQGMLGIAALAGVVLSFLLWFYYDQQISGQQGRNTFLQDEIAKVKQQNEEIKELDAKKDRLLARKKVIEELQANRSQMVHLFDSLVRTIPDGVTLNSIKQEGEVLTLLGSAQSNARVSAYMRNLEVSGWMTKPDLSIIEVKKNDKNTPVATSASQTLPYSFSLKVQLANPNAATAEGTAPGVEPGPAATGTTPGEVAPVPAAAPPTAPAAPAAAPATAPSAPPVETTQPQQPAAQTEGRPAS